MSQVALIRNTSSRLAFRLPAFAYTNIRGFRTTGVRQKGTSPAQSASSLAPIGVNAAIQAANDPSYKPKPKIFDEFALTDRVGIVSGGNRGLGLEMALALCEAGARAIYCFDLPTTPSEDWTKAKDYVERLQNGSRLEYVSADVRKQKTMWEKVEEIGDREGRMDVCVAAAGILKTDTDCLTYPAKQFQDVLDVNTNGVLYTAQAAGQQMRRYENGGSIILIASMSGSITNKVSGALCRVEHLPDENRTMHGCRTIRASPLFSRWHGAWHANWAQRTSVSTRCPQDTFILRASQPPAFS